ncbi:MAG: ATP synthase subunit I [Negativicutes bacterium]
MSFEQKTISKGIMQASVVVALVFAMIAFYFFSLSGLLAFFLGGVVSMIYFVMLRNRIAKVAPGKKSVAYMVRGLVLRLFFMFLAIMVLIKSGFNPLAVLLGVMVTPVGNKIYSIFLIRKGIKEFTRR